MLDGQMNDGTSPDTVGSAALRIASLLSDDEDTQPTEPLPPRKAQAPAAEPTAPDEDAADESDDDAATAGDDVEEGEEEDEEQTPEPRKVTVKVDGADVEVTEDELKAGYSRTADYTRKTQALAEERKSFQSEAQAVRAEREQYRSQLESLARAIAAVTPEEPNWQRLRQEVAPDEFAAAWADWQQHHQRMAQLKSEHERVSAQVAADQQGQLATHLKTEQERLLAAIPGWKDSATAKKEKAELIDYAKANGFNDDELSGITDHRALVLLRKAALYDKAQRARPVVNEAIQKVKVATPGPGSKRATPTELTRSKQRLAKTNSLADGAATILHLLGD